MKSRSKNSRSNPVLHLLTTYIGEIGWMIPRVKPWVLSEAMLHVGEELAWIARCDAGGETVPATVL